MKPDSILLGYTGLLPFFGLPLAISLQWLPVFEGIHYFSTYSAIILSFFGGIMWWQEQQTPSNRLLLYLAMLPSIAAWFSLILFAPAGTLIALAVCYVGVLGLEVRLLPMRGAYRRLRMRLTFLVVSSHILMMWVYSA